MTTGQMAIAGFASDNPQVHEAPRSSNLGHCPVRFWLGLAAAGVLVRLVLAACSIGTNDAATFHRFGEEINRHGIVGTYVWDPFFNHPPLVGLWTWAATVVARWLPGPLTEEYRTCLILKIPVIAADLLGVWLLWRIWRPKIGPRRAAMIAAAFAWSLDTILVSGFHCNTDPAYAVLCLAATCLIQERRAHFWGGTLLGAAINVKIIPVLLVPPLLLYAPGRRERLAMLLGLSIGAIPFVPLIWAAFPSFWHNALAYNSSVVPWGIHFFLSLLRHGGASASAMAPRLIGNYHSEGRFLLFASIALWAVGARLRTRWNAYEVAAVTFALFLVLAPGFGLQYTVVMVPLLFALRPRLAFTYATAAGVFLAIAYWRRLVPGAWPLVAYFGEGITLPEAIPGLVAWAILTYFLIATTRRPPDPVTESRRWMAPVWMNPAAPAADTGREFYG